MCGRFTLTTPTDELAEYFRILEGGLPSARGRLVPRYNIAPTQPVACVRRVARIDAPSSDSGGSSRSSRAAGPRSGRADESARHGDAPVRELVEMRWGLIPYWAKDPAIGNRMINARAESVTDKPAYKEAFRRRRCLVVADGFYEWQKREGGKQPYYIYLKDHRPFAFAGLWERWKPRGDQLRKIAGPHQPEVPLADDGRVESCAFLTTAPNELLEPIHDRMPLILPEQHWDAWLDPALDDIEALEELLVPYPAEEMAAHPVSTRVNKPDHDDPACIKPLERLEVVRPDASGDGDDSGEHRRPEPEQESLF